MFDPRPNTWTITGLHGRTIYRFDHLDGAAPILLPSIKAVMCWMLQHYSSAYVDGIYSRLRTMLRDCARLEGTPIHALTETTLMNFRSAKPENEFTLSGLGAFLKRWHRLGFAGVSEGAVRFLREARLKGNPKGVAVATMDPRTGPLTDLELTSVLEALTSAYQDERIETSDYVAGLFLILLGPRPVQVAAMKASDLQVATAPDCAKSYALRVPRAKNRLLPRIEFKIRPLPPQVGELVERHVLAVCGMPEARESPDPPMFPATTSWRAMEPSVLGHATGPELAKRFAHVLSRIAPVSERTQERLHLTALRFRRTLATRAVAEGYGLRIVAELLDHSDCQNVRVYAGIRPAIYERIKRATLFDLAPIVGAFQGTPVAELPGGLRRITDPRADRSMRRPVGCCGNSRICDFAAPVACYTCRSFHPWLEGPHERALSLLLKEHERLRKTCDEAIAASLTRTIYAAAEVVLACRAHRSTHGNPDA